MSIEDLDLDINNYDLEDIISLFKIKYDFSKSDLKKAKRIVLNMHPDKSNLDKKYFLFFSTAYKLLFSIYEFRYKSVDAKLDPTKVYVAEKDEQKEEILKAAREKLKNTEDFNKWFNELFEKTKISDEEADAGYEEWFRDQNNDAHEQPSGKISQSQMHENFAKKKTEMRALAVYGDIQEMQSSSGGQSELARGRLDNYSSDVFGKLQYNDLKMAHTETLIPVTEEDYLNRPKFNNVNELEGYRNRQDKTPLSLQQAQEYLKNTKNQESKIDIERAYKLAKQDEIVRKANDNWWGNLQKIVFKS